MMKTLSRTGTAKSDFNWISLARSGRGAGCRKELHEGITHSLPHLTLRIIRWASQSLPLTCLEPLVALPICLPVPLVPLAPWSPQVKSTKPLHSRHTCCPFCPGCPPSQSCSLFQAQLRYSSSRKLPWLQRGRPPERRTVLCHTRLWHSLDCVTTARDQFLFPHDMWRHGHWGGQNFGPHDLHLLVLCSWICYVMRQRKLCRCN